MNTLSKEDKKTFKLLWKKASELNDLDAQFELGYMYDFGNKVVRDKTKSFYWCKRTADQGCYRKGLCQLGYKYYSGDYVEQNTSKAVTLWSRAALLGDDKALFNLGLLYLHGDAVPKNEKKALKYYRRSAALGNLGAMGDLGVMLLNGEACEANEQEGLSLMTDAAITGHAVSQFNLGVISYYTVKELLNRTSILRDTG